MAINRAMRAALHVLAYPEVDIKKTYLVEREIKKLTARRLKNPSLYHIWEHKIFCGDHEVPVRIFMPDNRRRDCILLFFHGGGWVTGTVDSYSAVCADMANMTGCLVASVDYLLAPEHRFPAGLEDCYAVARELFLNRELMEALDIVLIGDSAGGNLAAAVSLMARDRGEFLPGRQILIYPAVGNDGLFADSETGTGLSCSIPLFRRGFEKSILCTFTGNKLCRAAGHIADHGAVLPSARRG